MTDTDSEQTSSGRSPENGDENYRSGETEHDNRRVEIAGELGAVRAENDALRERVADLESTVADLVSALDRNEPGPEASSTGQEVTAEVEPTGWQNS